MDNNTLYFQFFRVKFPILIFGNDTFGRITFHANDSIKLISDAATKLKEDLDLFVPDDVMAELNAGFGRNTTSGVTWASFHYGREVPEAQADFALKIMIVTMIIILIITIGGNVFVWQILRGKK